MRQAEDLALQAKVSLVSTSESTSTAGGSLQVCRVTLPGYLYCHMTVQMCDLASLAPDAGAGRPAYDPSALAASTPPPKKTSYIHPYSISSLKCRTA